MRKPVALTDADKRFVKLYIEHGNAPKAAMEAYGIDSPARAAIVAARQMQNPMLADWLEYELGIQQHELQFAARKAMTVINATLDTTIDEIIDPDTLHVKSDLDKHKMLAVDKIDFGVTSEGERYVKSVKMQPRLQAAQKALALAGITEKRAEVNVNVSILQHINSDVVSEQEVDALISKVCGDDVIDVEEDEGDNGD